MNFGNSLMEQVFVGNQYNGDMILTLMSFGLLALSN